MKLDDKSQKCIFIGYNDVPKGYKLYNLVTKKVIMSKDVQFIKDEVWIQNKKMSNNKVSLQKTS